MHLKELNVEGYEKVYQCTDPVSGLNAITVIHNTNRGEICLGGCRMFPYKSDEEMLEDALHLSSKMTYKNALAKLDFGGSKCVIRADPNSQKTRELLLAMGRFIDALDGQLYTGQDSGITAEDVDLMHEETSFLVGLKGKSGNPAIPTALGVYAAMVTSVREIKRMAHLNGLHIVVYGLGGVGYNLLEHLQGKGAKVFVTDSRKEQIDKALKEYDVIPVYDPEKIFSVPCDIFSANVTGSTYEGGALNKKRVDIIYNSRRGRGDVIICGGTNVLFTDKNLVEYVHRLPGFHYMPGEVVNAGGVISVASDITGQSSEQVRKKVLEVGETIQEIIDYAKKKKVSYASIAKDIAQERVNPKKINLEAMPVKFT
jgi:leucine dehydrogenase